MELQPLEPSHLLLKISVQRRDNGEIIQDVLANQETTCQILFPFYYNHRARVTLLSKYAFTTNNGYFSCLTVL